MTIRQAALEAQLAPSRSPSPGPLTHVQEEAALRKETISAFHSAGSRDGDDEDDLLIPREKTKDEQEQEEEEYRVFLEREVGDLHEVIGVPNDVLAIGVESEDRGAGEVDERKRKKKIKERGSPKSKEGEDQAFLMEYVNPYFFTSFGFFNSRLFLATSSTVVGLINPRTVSPPTKKLRTNLRSPRPRSLDLPQHLRPVTTLEMKMRSIFRIRPSILSMMLSKLHTISVLKNLRVQLYPRSLVPYPPLFAVKIQDVKMLVKSESNGRRERWRKRGRK